MPDMQRTMVGGAGTCNGGQNSGAACVTQVVHADFGATSYDCMPAVGTALSGNGAVLSINLADGDASLPFGDACDSPLQAQMCACGTCSSDNRVPCNGDAECVGSELVSVFCVPPIAGSAGKNGAYGLPGAARLAMDWAFTPYCPDATTPWELGGSNCP